MCVILSLSASSELPEGDRFVYNKKAIIRTAMTCRTLQDTVDELERASASGSGSASLEPPRRKSVQEPGIPLVLKSST